MGLKVYQLIIDDSSDRLLVGKNEFNRTLGGALIVPAGTTFPTSSYAREMFWNVTSASLYIRNEANTDWISLAGADAQAPYVTVGNTGLLPNERALTAGTGLVMTDAGANSTVTFDVNNNVVATLTGSLFSGPVIAAGGLSGSLQKTSAGLSYLVAGTGIGINSMSNGQVVIENAFATAAPADSAASYLVVSATSSLSNERVFSTAGTSLSSSDGGAGGLFTLDIANTGSAGTYGTIQVNEKGQVTSGSTSWFGQNFWFTSGSQAVPFHNVTTTYLSAINMTASNLTAGTYRLGWSYTFRVNSVAASFRARTFMINSASFDTIEEVSEVGANERHMRSGFAYLNITGSVALFSIDASIETAATNTTASMYDRALELWKVS